MKVRTEKGAIIELDNLQFCRWIFDILVRLQYSYPSLRLEGVDFFTRKKVRVALQQLELEWRETLTLNSGG